MADRPTGSSEKRGYADGAPAVIRAEVTLDTVASGDKPDTLVFRSLRS